MSRVVVALILAAVLAHTQPQGARQNASPSDLAATEKAVETAVRQTPSARGWERLGLIRHLQNKYSEAIPAFQEALRLDSALWTSHLFLGISLYRTNEFASALSSLQTAERLAKGAPQGRDDLEYWLAATHIALRQPLKGLQVLEQLLQRNPKHVEALELATRTYSDASTSEWNQVAETHFETAAGYEVHGHALESEGNREGALDAFRQSKALNPKRAGPGLEIGRMLLMEGKAPEALEVLEQELQLAGTGPEAFYYAGLAAIQLNRHADAARWLETASKWTVQNPEAPVALAQVYLALQEPQKAVTAARDAIALDPSSPVAHDLLIAALTQVGNTEAAEAERQRWSEQSKP